MNRIKNLIAVFAFSLLILGLPAIASAQWRDNRNDDYYGNGNYNRSLQSTIKNLKNNTKEFAKRLDRELDRSRYDGSNREDRINEIANNFRDAVKDLDNSYDNRSDYNRSQDEVRRVLSLGSRLDNALSRARLSYNLQNDWSRIRQDLRVLSDSFNYDYRNNRNDDYRNNRNNRRRNNRNYPFPF